MVRDVGDSIGEEKYECVTLSLEVIELSKLVQSQQWYGVGLWSLLF